MKRFGFLYNKIAEMDNLKTAFWKAYRHKRGVPEAELFRSSLAAELDSLRSALLKDDVAVGDYHYFRIYDPKERLICAASFRERVLHHAVMNVCDTCFECPLITDTYACRKGMGLHSCIERAKVYTRRYKWYLKLDVRKYFDSVDHVHLKELLCRLFKDARLISLFERIIESYESSSGRGIPIGNLTSQYFANYYLSGLDHLVKEEMGVLGYVRYMDDFVLWDDSKEKLKEALGIIESFCMDKRNLKLKPPCLNRCSDGISMLGYRVFPEKVLLTHRSRKRFVRKLKLCYEELNAGMIDQDEFAERTLPLCAYIEHADSRGFRNGVIKEFGDNPRARTA